jgi:hypothetical protein
MKPLQIVNFFSVFRKKKKVKKFICIYKKKSELIFIVIKLIIKI